MMKKFYVYAHYVPGSSEPFYVGKGHGNRAWSLWQRSAWWKSVTGKRCPDGKPAVKLLAEGASEEEALAIEKFWVAVLGRKDTRSDGCLINLTDGGEGVSGWKASAETRKRMSEANMGRPGTMNGRKHSEEARRKISAAGIGRPGTMLGKRHSEETKRKISLIGKGRVVTEETRRKMSRATKGANNPMYGKSPSAEIRKKISLAGRGRVAPDDVRLRMAIAAGAVPFTLVHTSGMIDSGVSQSAFARKHNLKTSALSALIRGTYKSTKGWKLLSLDVEP